MACFAYVVGKNNLKPWLALSALAFFAPGLIAPQAHAQGMRPASVVVAEVQEESLTPVQEFVGTVIPSRRSVIGSAVDGRVIEYRVDAGQKVIEEEPMAQLRTGTIEIEIKGARAELRLRDAELAELREGARPEERAQGEARLQAAKALAAYAKARLERTRQMATTGGLVSAEELDLAVSQYQSAEQRRIEAEESLGLILAGTRAEQIDQAIAKQETQQEMVALLEDRLKKYTIRAPYDGYVVKEYTEAGAWVRQGDPIAEVIDIDPVEIEVNVPESSAVHLRQGTKIRIVVDALPDKVFEGELSQVVPDADPRTRTFPVKIRVPNAPEDETDLLRPGMLARAKLPAGRQITGLSIPKDAVVFGGPQPTVFVVSENAARPVSVQIQVASDQNVIVLGDLKVGDKVVTRGNERLRPGQAVTIQTP